MKWITGSTFNEDMRANLVVALSKYVQTNDYRVPINEIIMEMQEPAVEANYKLNEIIRQQEHEIKKLKRELKLARLE